MYTIDIIKVGQNNSFIFFFLIGIFLENWPKVAKYSTGEWCGKGARLYLGAKLDRLHLSCLLFSPSTPEILKA